MFGLPINMASECTLMWETEPPIPFTCADGTGIEKGAILKLTDPMTCALADGDGDYIAGIAAEEKIASDGKTKISVYMGGIFKGLAGGAITIGDALATYASTGATNEIVEAAAGNVGCATLGYSLEAADDTHTFLFVLKPACNNTAYA